ncbi:MAG TPA: ABC transporter permease [Gaiellaceae bacterium]|nr:ABC transporter permease [Gaiellaceae bacterium]
MIDQIRAELLKIRSTRTTLGLVVGMIGLIVLFALLSGLLTKAPNLATSEDQRGILDVGSTAGLFSALAGVMLITSEYRHGTIKPTFLFDPRRSRVLAAKAIAGLLAGIALGLVGVALGFGIGALALHTRGIPFALTGAQTALLIGGALAAVALWGVIGVAVGAIVRSQVGTIIGLLAWGLIIDNLLFAFVPSVGRYSPNRAENALEGLTAAHLLPAAAGGAVLLAWAAALTIAGILATARRDVT